MDVKTFNIETEIALKANGNLQEKIRQIIVYYANNPDKIPEKRYKKVSVANIDSGAYEKLKKHLKNKGWKIVDFINERIEKSSII